MSLNPLAVAQLPLLADLLEYPCAGYFDRVERTRAAIAVDFPAVAESLEPLAVFAAESDQAVWEERFTRTFDIAAPCCLEIGWQLFGENYHRGGLLVKLRVALREYGVDEGTELPDHLVPVLRLIAKLPPEMVPEDLAHDGILPALQKMHASLAPDENPWACVLVAVEELLLCAYGPAEAPMEVMEV